MKVLKKTLSMILVVATMLSMVPAVSAASEPEIAVGNATVDVSGGAATVQVPVVIENNPGFAGMDLNFSIPTDWSITEINAAYLTNDTTKYSIFCELTSMTIPGVGTFEVPSPFVNPEVNENKNGVGSLIAAYGVEDITTNGTICWVTYAVPAETFDGDYEIIVTSNKINTVSATGVDISDGFTFTAGTVTVTGGVDTTTLTPAFTTQPENAAYSYGDTAAALSVSASVAAGNLSYQWYSNTTDSNQGGTKIDGATAASYTPELTTYGDAYYYCVVTNTYNERAFSAASEAVKITYQKAVVSEVQLSSLGIADPVKNAVPQTEINTAQYTGTITWNGNPAKFLGGTAYTASVTLNLKDTTNCEFASNVTVSGATNVQLNGQTLTFDVVYDATAAKELAFIAITKNPTKINYIDGETFAADGMEVTATYDDGTTEVVTGYTYPDAALVTGQTVVTVTYGEKTADVTVTVEANTLESIAVSGDFKKDYTVGDAADWTGMVVTATYKRGNTETVTGTVSGFDTSKYAESQTITVSYTEDGVTKTDTFTVSVDRITNAGDNFTVNIPQGAVYNGEPHVVTVTPKDGVTAGAITVYYDGSATAPTDVGTYAVTYSVAVSDTHTALDNVPDGNLVIAPKSVDVSVNEISAQTYDGSAKEPAVTLTVTGLVGEDQLENEADYTVSYSNNTNAGTATVVVTANANRNYTFTAATQNFVIEKQGVDIPTANTGLVYNDSEQIGVTLPDGAKYTLSGNTGTNAGSYTATATLTDSANYKWNGVSENESAPQNIVWTIGRKVVDRDPSAVTGLVYTGSEQTGVAGIEGQYTVTNGAKIDAGNYEATAALTSNYKWSDDTTADKTVEWSIAQAEVTVPNTNVTFTYDGSEKTAVAAGDHYTISGDNAKTDVGSYTVTLALESANYKWATEFGGSFTWTITKAAARTDLTGTAGVRYDNDEPQVVDKNTFLADAKDIVITDVSESSDLLAASADSDGNLTFTLDDSVVKANAGQTAEITVTFNSRNYADGSKTVITVTITDKINIGVGADENKISFTGNSTLTYNGTAQTPVFALADGFTAGTNGSWTYEYKLGGDTVTEMKNAGTYTVTASYEDDTYFGKSEPVTITVNPAALTVVANSAAVTAKDYDGTTAAAITAVTFDGLLGSDALTLGTDYTVAGVFADKNAGQNKTVTVTVALSDTAAAKNYTVSDTGVATGTINPKNVTVSVNDIADQTFDGSAKEPAVTLTVTGLVGEDQLENGTDYTVFCSGNTNAGTATVTVTAEAGSNYTFIETGKNFTINKASAPTLSVDGTVDFKYTVTGDKTVTIQGVPANAGSAVWSVGAVTDVSGVLNGTPTVADGVVSFVLNGLQAYSEGIIATIPVTVVMDNYADATVSVVISIKDRDVPEVSVGNLTVAYTGVELTDAAIEGTASVDGSWVWVTKPAGTAASETPYDAQVKFVPTDLVNYTEVTRNITVTINKADPAGTPAYTAINTSGKTLADAELAVGTLTPADGTLVWLDQEGTPVADPTAVKVEANKEYTWQYTPADTDNYNVVTGKITPYVYIYNPPAGGGGGGASTKPSTSTEVTKNEDGSTTTTVTDNKTGTVTETTTKTETTKTEDGSTITTDTKVETVTNKDGAVTTTTTTKTETADKTETVEVKEESVVKEDGTTETKTTSTTTAELADGTTATSTTDETGKTEAQVTVSEKAAASEEPVVLPIPAVTVTTDSAKAATVTVTIDSTKETTVEIPVADVTPGAVIVIVNEDGTEEVVKKTGLTENGLAVELEGSATVKIVENSKTFVDVDPDVWYADGVDFASSRELYNGVGNDRFDPNGDMTRGMLVTVLHRMEDEMEHAYEGSYHDVVEGHWATDAIHWASDHGIVDGYGNGCYGTNDSITREQMITMVYRYLNWMGVDTSARGDLTAFNDHGEISSWAQEAVQWGVGIGIINGVGNDMLDPGSCATRAQVAVFMQRVTNLMF